MVFRLLHRTKNWRHTVILNVLVFTVILLTCLIAEVNPVSAQQTEIAILMPSTASGIPEGDVSYARTVSRRFAQMLRSIGFTADELQESSVANNPRLKDNSSKPYRLIILPLNSKISLSTVSILNSFVARGGKLFVTYNLADEVASLMGLKSIKWLKAETPGQFSSIRLDAPDILGLPTNIKQSSWNITAVESTTPQTKIIGHWYNSNGESTGYPAFFLGENGIFFSHVFLSDDIQTKTQLLAALLGHLIPEFQHAIAKREIDMITSIGHIKNLDALTKFISFSELTEAKEDLQSGKTLSIQAQSEYAKKNYHTAMTAARDSRNALSKAYALSHLSDETEGRALWNHSGLGAYPGDWERSAKELANAGINIILPNMAWAGLAHYDSSVLPKSNKYAEYGDQISQCVNAAHNNGIQVHVWKITWNLEGAPKEFVEKMRKEGRTQVSAEGNPINWLCPSNPENVKLELNAITEIVQNYKVDGIHLDYIRYPGSHACYCTECRDRFILASKLKIQEWPTDVLPRVGKHSSAYTDWRVEQITRLVRLIHKRVRGIRPKVKISAAVFGGYPSCVTSIGQDWIAWAKAGYIDFVCPMNYTEDDTYFTDLLENQLALMPKDVAIYPGIGATASNSLLKADAVIGQIHLARFLGASGWAIFDYSSNISNTILPAIQIGVGRLKSTPPH
ncbi:family 10 glycosylhydrolase [Candidatus Poribacteria bacterium]|nr:family 10 glycosylhydrolase [Candidatus Poribacteria bacterium]MYI93727.1 family 10 glycosylhydrolase [Candidatus Poribacteria bacterium]